jgi:leucyl-tRNA synthetase
MWQMHQGGKKTFQSIHVAPWPKSEPKFAKEDTVTLVVQVNGKVRDSFEIPAGISESETQELALSREKVKSALQGVLPKRVIYIPGRLINIVV